MLPYSKWYRSVPRVLRTGVGDLCGLRRGICVGCVEGSENLAGSGSSESIGFGISERKDPISGGKR